MEDKKPESLNELETKTLLTYRGKAVERMDQKEKLAQRLKGIKRSGEKIKERMPKKQVTEQHREEGRFKPVKPHNVKSVATVSPRSTSDSADVKLKEEIQLDELSKGTLASYAKKSSFDAVSRAMKYGVKNDQSGGEAKNLRKIHNREFGIRKAINRLANEETQLDEISSKLANSYLEKKRERDYEKTGPNTYSSKKPMSMSQASKSMKNTVRALKRTEVKEETVVEGENKEMKGKDPCWKGYEMVGMKKKNGKDVPNCVPANEQMDNAPYSAPYAERKSGKDTVDSMSLAKQLAKTAAKKQSQRMSESFELNEESRKAQIVREAVKKSKEKNKKNNNDKFESEPELSDSITKTE